jgi:uncharacterized protein YlxP (DUF503 family)
MPFSVVSVELHLPGVRSLKEKRRIVKSLQDRIHTRYRVSIAETRYHDLHQRAELGIATVAPSVGHLEDLVASVRELVQGRVEVVVTRWDERIVEAAP